MGSNLRYSRTTSPQKLGEAASLLCKRRAPQKRNVPRFRRCLRHSRAWDPEVESRTMLQTVSYGRRIKKMRVAADRAVSVYTDRAISVYTDQTISVYTDSAGDGGQRQVSVTTDLATSLRSLIRGLRCRALWLIFLSVRRAN